MARALAEALNQPRAAVATVEGDLEGVEEGREGEGWREGVGGGGGVAGWTDC